jgi:hypothetical protein
MEEGEKTGRFGIGFQSVHHITGQQKQALCIRM